eukprot:281863_1
MGNTMSVLSAITLLSVANWSTVSAAKVKINFSFKKKFDSIDTNGDDKINKDEVLAFINLAGEDATKVDPSDIIALGDTNGDRTLDYEEFSAMMPLVTMFNGIDKDRDGKLSKDEFGAGYTLNGGLEEDINEEFAKADVNNAGSLEYSEFVKVPVFIAAAKKIASSGVLVSASLSCLFIILLQLF